MKMMIMKLMMMMMKMLIMVVWKEEGRTDGQAVGVYVNREERPRRYQIKLAIEGGEITSKW